MHAYNAVRISKEKTNEREQIYRRRENCFIRSPPFLMRVLEMFTIVHSIYTYTVRRKSRRLKLVTMAPAFLFFVFGFKWLLMDFFGSGEKRRVTVLSTVHYERNFLFATSFAMPENRLLAARHVSGLSAADQQRDGTKHFCA